jgi:hypothetical protein
MHPFGRSASDAGRSGFERHRQARFDFFKEHRGAITFSVALPLAATAYAVAADTSGLELYLLGFISGMYAMLLMALWIYEPRSVARLKQGAQGEVQTAQELDKLRFAGWRPVHDRKLGGRNIDHVMVGPGGVFAIETKNWSGPISVRNGKVMQGGIEHPRLGAKAINAAVEIHDVIEIETGLRAWVESVVVFWGDFPQGEVQEKNVTYVAGGELAAWLHARPPKLSGTQADAIAAAIAGMPPGTEISLAS